MLFALVTWATDTHIIISFIIKLITGSVRLRALPKASNFTNLISATGATSKLGQMITYTDN